jgi:putative DNA methylase
MSSSRKKLIEVALPLEAINKASAREKSIRHGHPSTLHLWWARRPLAAARAVIFAQMVDDPSASPDLFKTEKAQEKERQRLFKIIEDLVQWENTNNGEVLEKARAEIWQSWRRACADNVDHPRAKELFDRSRLPAFHDPFAGGGALPLEAQRLGLEGHASDLNPVAVLICKAMIEIPPRFAGRPPVNPEAREEKTLAARQWKGAEGLAEDVRYYGQWMRDQAKKRIGHLYPKIEIIAGMATEQPDLKPLVGQKLTVIAWLWARTVKSPNPAFRNVDVPLVSSFILATKPGKEAYVEPTIGDGYRFVVRVGKPKDIEAAKTGTKLTRGANFRCVMSGTPIAPDYIYAEANAGRMGAKLMAIVAEGERGRVYLSPLLAHEAKAGEAKPTWRPDVTMPENPRWFSPPLYGLKTFGDLFTPRQLVALTTFADLVHEVTALVQRDAAAAGRAEDGNPLRDGGNGATAYAEAVGVYLALSASKSADNNSTICSWMPGLKYEVVRNTFSRQALPMSWDYAESNPFAESSGDFFEQVKRALLVFEIALASATIPGKSEQADAQSGTTGAGCVVSTDPPYYDNIGYADLSDYFYVWLRRSLCSVFPNLFATLAVPKLEELVATPYRHGSREKAEAFFLEGMSRAMRHLSDKAHPHPPVTIYYAFKQSESDDVDGITNTGWDTFLDALVRAGFSVSGTWPMRTERGARSVGIGTNALASSIVLVCRRRFDDAPTATRREFVNALKTELPTALVHLQKSNIAPVDLAQAAIGPGMAVYTRFAQVVDAGGNALSVREALALINQTLDEVLAEQEGDFDGDTRWAVAWFEQQGFAEGEFGLAEILSKAKNTSVGGMVEAGILASKRGKVRLLKPEELSDDWSPVSDARLTAWQTVHQLIRGLEAGGESAAGSLVAKLGSKAEIARELAYRLYTIAERKKRAAEALSYNTLVQSWPEITRLARAEATPSEPAQAALL